MISCISPFSPSRAFHRVMKAALSVGKGSKNDAAVMGSCRGDEEYDAVRVSVYCLHALCLCEGIVSQRKVGRKEGKEEGRKEGKREEGR